MLASWYCGLVGGARLLPPGFELMGFCPYIMHIENFVPPLSVPEAWVNKQLLLITEGLQLLGTFQGASRLQVTSA